MLNVKPGSGVGAILLGMSRPQIAEILGESPERFRKTPTCEVDTDAFDSLGIHVYYDRHELCEYIECYRDREQHIVRGVAVLELPAREVLMRLSPFFELAESEGGGCSYTDAEAGVTLWRSGPEEHRFEAVGVAHSSYFERAA